MTDAQPSKVSPRILVVVFCVALATHFGLTTYHWTIPFLSGHEFRQTQTALVTRYIDQDRNFSPIYETPLVGKPWVSILMEVPFYEWSVVGLSRLTGWRYFLAARTVTLTCFYLTLPALFLLLGRIGLNRARRLFVLSLVLVCPVYIYYSRAFLMESMEFMWCAWFLLGFVRTMDRRRWGWLLFTMATGVLAILIKGSTLAVWLWPAMAYGAWCLWRTWGEGQNWRKVGSTALWGFATIIPAFFALKWWVDLTDPIKAAHPSAWIFTSKNLSEGNWGLTNLAARFSPSTWGVLADRWAEAVSPWWLIPLGLAIGAALLPRVRWAALGVAASFFVAQLLFPFAYAYQDYYFYACAVFLLGGVGLFLLGVLDSRLAGWCKAMIVAVPFFALQLTYWTGYREGQASIAPGGFDYTHLIKDLTPPNSVIIVGGQDWCASLPYYADRRALMIRNGLEYDQAYLDRAFNDLSDEDVSVLVVEGKGPRWQPLISKAVAKFNLEPTPTCRERDISFYFSRPYAEAVRIRLRSSLAYPDIRYDAKANSTSSAQPFGISPALARSSFPMVSPAPVRGYFTFGIDHVNMDGIRALSAHPSSELWIPAPPAAHLVEWTFGLLPQAYLKQGDRTNGVAFVVIGETPDGKTREIFRRVLEPTTRPGDRGMQNATVKFTPRPEEILHFISDPNGQPAYDWAYWKRINVK